MITELRRYRIKPGRMASWISVFEEAARRNEAGGSQVEFAGVDRDSSTFVWLRTYADEADRESRKATYYAARWWVDNEAFAMDHVLEYDVVFLDTTIRREGGTMTVHPWTTAGERPGIRPDGPPEGWVLSTHRSFIPGG